MEHFRKYSFLKSAGLMMITGLFSAAAAIGGYRYLEQSSERNELIEESNYRVDFASYPNSPKAMPANPDLIQAASTATPAVVHIKTTYTGTSSRRNAFEELFGNPGSSAPSRASGSGVLISADGYIVTNNHVVENASTIEVSLPDRRSFTAKLIGRDPSTDLALVKVEGTNLPVVELGNSDQVQVGEWVLAVGYPLSLNSTVTAGIISAKGRSIGILDQATPGRGSGQGVSTAIESFIQTDAAINPGNSGGALVNATGQLIGINAAIASQTGSYAGYGFAIPINLARKVINDLRAYGEVRRGLLGVSFPAPSVEEELLKQQGINPGSVQGVYITSVQPGSAAAAAGLKTGDVIQSIDNTRVASSAEFSERIARHRPGDKVAISYLRNGKTVNTNATLKGQNASPTLAGNPGGENNLVEKLGAQFGPVPAAVKQYFGLNAGMAITAVSRGSFFERAGIPRNSVITSVNGRTVNSTAELNSALANSTNGMARIEGITPEGMRFVFNFPLGA